MDSHTTVEILRGCLVDPTADSHLVNTVLHLTPTPRNALVLYRPQPPFIAVRKAVFPAELFEMILIALAQDCPSFLLTNTTRVNRLFRDTIKDSQTVKTILFKNTNPSHSSPEPSKNSTISSNPALRKFDIGVVTEWPPTMGKDYQKNKHSLNGNVFAFSSSFHSRPWAEIQLSDNNEEPIEQSCDDMRLFDLPQAIEVHVRYQVEIKGTQSRTSPSEVGQQDRSIRKKVIDPSTIHMVAIARTKATTVKKIFQVARELNKYHPDNWEERRFGRWGSVEVSLSDSDSGNAAQEMVVSNVKFEEMESADEYIGWSTMGQPWVMLPPPRSFTICSIAMPSIA